MKAAFKRRISIILLFIITVISAMQYVLLGNIPESVSTFSFICITNIIGIFVVTLFYFKHLKGLNKITLFKGAILAIELLGMNFFLILGTRGTDTVVVASVLSMYFIFINPILRFLKKSVNFFHGIASIIAIIALLLLMGGNIQNLLKSPNVIYLFIADAFFAVYVISISEFSENEDSPRLTIVQMMFTIAFSFVGWVVEVILGRGSFSFPKTPSFWISAIFIGILIRAVYGLIQFSCQKNVPTIIACFIYSSEVVITLLLTPVLNTMLKLPFSVPTMGQYIGCFFFILASLIIDDSFMDKIGFGDLNRQTISEKSVANKIVKTTIVFSMLSIILVNFISGIAILIIKNNSIDETKSLGENMSYLSAAEIAFNRDLEIENLTKDKANLASAKFTYYIDAAKYAASIATDIYAHGSINYARETQPPKAENEGKWTMQRGLANKDIVYEDVKEENMMMSYLEPAFKGIIANNRGIVSIYIASKSGIMNSYDQYSFDPDDEELYYDHTEAVWFKLAQTTDDYAFCDTYYDNLGKGQMVTCVAPFRNADGEFQGCIGIDILIDDINSSVLDEGLKDEYSAIIFKGDKVIASNNNITEFPEIFREDVAEVEDPVTNNVFSEENEYEEIKALLDEYSSIEDIHGRYLYAVNKIAATDWYILVYVPAEEVFDKIYEMRHQLLLTTQEAADEIINEIRDVVQFTLIATALIIMFISFFVGTRSKRISTPIIQLSNDASIIASGNLDYRSSVNTDDEIGSLAKSFNEMTESLQSYIENIREVTLREQKVNSELQLAANIQLSSLPYNFPDCEDYSLYATVSPAKEVGGDFYDFFKIDETHLGLVIADVSGKGVPAALFMMKSKTLIKSLCDTKKSTAEVIAAVNNILCEGNEAEMFVTVWLGIVDLENNVINAVNAGHEYPIIKHANGDFELLKDKHGMVLGGLEDMNYTEYTIELAAGDRIFVYTDGVPEATNSAEELFGTDRLIEALNANKDKDVKELLVEVRNNIDAFVKDAPQFDDITMLAFDYKK